MIFTYQISDNKVSQTSKPILLSEFLLSNIKDSDVSNYITKMQTGLLEQTSKGAIIANLKLKANENHVNGLGYNDGKIIAVPQGYISDTKEALEEYKKQYSSYWNAVLSGTGEILLDETEETDVES
jgi:hypothetical protein